MRRQDGSVSLSMRADYSIVTRQRRVSKTSQLDYCNAQHSPTHVFPSLWRTKPSGHWHRKLPGVLMHWPLWQTSTPVTHSSTSTHGAPIKTTTKNFYISVMIICISAKLGSGQDHTSMRNTYRTTSVPNLTMTP